VFVFAQALPGGWELGPDDSSPRPTRPSAHSDLRSFTHGLTHDHDVVLVGRTLEHGSGAVEGKVNRIRMIKRQLYGRAGFGLLRKRVLLAT
jgi:transposase